MGGGGGGGREVIEWFEWREGGLMEDDERSKGRSAEEEGGIAE